MKYKQTLPTAFLLMVSFFATPVYAVCSNVTVSNANFGTVTTQNNITAYHLADITVSCDTPADAYLLGMNAGLHFSGSRQLAHTTGGQFITYSLLQGNGGSEWGDNGLNANTYSQPPLSGSGTNTYAVYATAATQDKFPQGNFSDIVTITLADSAGVTLKTIQQSITLDLVAFCTLNTSAVTGDFGSYPLGSNAVINDVSLGTVAVTCPATVAYKIGIDKGLHLTGGVRQMALNGNLIPYTLKYGSGGAEWGDLGLNAMDSSYNETFATANAVSNTSAGVTQTFDVYGDASIANANAIGIYTDTLIVTLVW